MYKLLFLYAFLNIKIQLSKISHVQDIVRLFEIVINEVQRHSLLKNFYILFVMKVPYFIVIKCVIA